MAVLLVLRYCSCIVIHGCKCFLLLFFKRADLRSPNMTQKKEKSRVHRQIFWDLVFIIEIYCRRCNTLGLNCNDKAWLPPSDGLVLDISRAFAPKPSPACSRVRYTQRIEFVVGTLEVCRIGEAVRPSIVACLVMN